MIKVFVGERIYLILDIQSLLPRWLIICLRRRASYSFIPDPLTSESDLCSFAISKRACRLLFQVVYSECSLCKSARICFLCSRELLRFSILLILFMREFIAEILFFPLRLMLRRITFCSSVKFDFSSQSLNSTMVMSTISWPVTGQPSGNCSSRCSRSCRLWLSWTSGGVDPSLPCDPVSDNPLKIGDNPEYEVETKLCGLFWRSCKIQQEIELQFECFNKLAQLKRSVKALALCQ